ncbi:Gfral [Columba livia]|nr:Gfral [Columba livia]
MVALLCLVLFTYFTSISTAQTDCLHLREQCVNAANGCESVWNIVEDVCNISGNRCKAEDAIGCNRIIQVLADEYPEFKNCLCTADDFCSITTLLGKQCSINKDNISKEARLQWRLSSLSKQAYTANRTCLDVNKECVEDEVCNKQLSLYLKVCSVNKKCNMEECQAAIRFFYQNMPFEVAQMMAFCDCIQPDESCYRAKELLHGKPCAVTAVPPPSCLNVIHVCKENELCSNWGTMLRVECTCQNLPHMEQALCKLFHHMLHSKSCFSELRQISITKKDFHWVNTEVPEEKLSRAQLHSSSINGETVYVIAYSSCIVLILGIVLLTLLKIRFRPGHRPKAALGNPVYILHCPGTGDFDTSSNRGKSPRIGHGTKTNQHCKDKSSSIKSPPTAASDSPRARNTTHPKTHFVLILIACIISKITPTCHPDSKNGDLLCVPKAHLQMCCGVLQKYYISSLSEADHPYNTCGLQSLKITTDSLLWKLGKFNGPTRVEETPP